MRLLKSLVYLPTLLSFNALAHPGHDGLGMAGQAGLLWVGMGVVCVVVVVLVRLLMHLNSAKDDG